MVIYKIVYAELMHYDMVILEYSSPNSYDSIVNVVIYHLKCEEGYLQRNSVSHIGWL